MKKLILILLALSAVVISSCTTAADGDGGVSGKNVIEEKSSEQKDKTAVTRTINIPYVVKETDYFSDGYIESYKVYSYNDDMSPLREDLFDSFDELIESTVYEKISAAAVKESLFNARGQLQSWKINAHGDEGQLLRVEAYNAEEVLQTVSEYEYDESGNKVVWRVLDGAGVILSETRYVYEGGMNTLVEIYDSALNMQDYFQNEYESGLLVRNTHFGENGDVLSVIEYTYDGKTLVTEKYLRPNGSTSRTLQYTNDANGSPVKIEAYNGNGDLKDWSEKEYEYVPEEITVWE